MTDLDTIKAALAVYELLLGSGGSSSCFPAQVAVVERGSRREARVTWEQIADLIAELEKLRNWPRCLACNSEMVEGQPHEAHYCPLCREKERANKLERELAECREMLRLACAGHPDDHDHWTECLPCQAAFAEPLAGKEE